MRCRNTTITYQFPTLRPPPPTSFHTLLPQLHCALLCSLTLPQLAALTALTLSGALAPRGCVCVCGRWQKFMLRTKVKQTQKSKRFAVLCCALLAGWPRPRTVGGASERALSCNIRASKMPASKRSTSTSETTETTHAVCARATGTNRVERVGS